jgi:hypothetical protein
MEDDQNVNKRVKSMMKVYGSKNKYWEEKYKWQESLRPGVANASTNAGTESEAVQK